MADDLMKDWEKLRLTEEEDKVYGRDFEEPNDRVSKSRIDLSLVGKLLTKKPFNVEAMKRVLKNLRSWAFDNQILLLQELNGDEQPSEVSFQYSPFWIRLLDVPFSRRTMSFAKEIGDSFGCFLEFDDSDSLGWEKFMQIKDMIEVEKPLRRGMKIDVGGDNTNGLALSMRAWGISATIVED
uniref:DUF4283 domain-containing protein n=1 Tax=Chenopodium quinoa TaxID=63459 RepID=A0A803LYW0_CHEQI